MQMNEYQQAALRTAFTQQRPHEVFHLLLGLVGETGEIAEKAKKIIRDHDADFGAWDRADLTKELGDVLWYLAVLADHFGITLEDVADTNVAKLADRQQRHVLSGSGDDR